MISLVCVAIEGLKHLQSELIKQGRHIRNLTAGVKKIEMTIDHINFHIGDNTNAIRF